MRGGLWSFKNLTLHVDVLASPFKDDMYVCQITIVIVTRVFW